MKIQSFSTTDRRLRVLLKSLYTRRFWSFVILVILLLGDTISQAQQIISDSVEIEGHYRVFHFHKPTQKLKNPSLIFVMHGSGGNGKDMMKGAVKMEQKTNAENAIAVYPDGYKKFWNECRKAAPVPANQENINEQAFFQSVINYFVKKYHVNKRYVFAVGTSGGGHMAYKLGLTMPESFRAITALIANLPDTNNIDCTPVGKPLPVMIVNGTNDNINPYNGGEVKIGFNMGFVRSTDRTFHYWSELAGYKGDPVKEDVPNTDPNDGRTIERYTYKEKGKPEVVLLKVIGGKHDYPNDIDIHTEAWEFFKRQMKGE
ncbi:poly(3-hydroxybutyrate) depolymerase [Xanthocytophaga agilis]|uniref:Poly(3-hydroxybutyrate) depolymerase n=1 Tax=Xanthocytophaga agilis TaxID=3048010 RepID=A0AAE3UE21_9BACT|nr:poly(3-hydroxybutyrate) depolymerase [Xanthocytophaga agilis]MDJ1501810.1 poly(3-hydroxybutyrate) depolymerase [Xanthocytophaga agilis]